MSNTGRFSLLLGMLFVVHSAAASSDSTVLSGPAPNAPLLGAQPAPFLAISVANLDVQLAWYRDKLGFVVSSQGTLPERQIRFALLRQGAAMVELLQIPEARPRAESSRTQPADSSLVHGFFKSGMVVEDVAGLFNRLKANGVTFAFELTKPPNGPYRVFGVNDPEGNLLQFFGV